MIDWFFPNKNKRMALAAIADHANWEEQFERSSPGAAGWRAPSEKLKNNDHRDGQRESCCCR